MTIKSFFPSEISKDQAKDTGMAVVLILLLIGLYLQNYIYIKAAIICLLIAMAIPLIYKYVADFWLGVSQLLGTYTSKILLSVIFFFIVSPVGLTRRLLGYDTLKLRQFKNGTDSVMQLRDFTFKKEDIVEPY